MNTTSASKINLPSSSIRFPIFKSSESYLNCAEMKVFYEHFLLPFLTSKMRVEGRKLVFNLSLGFWPRLQKTRIIKIKKFLGKGL